MSLFLSWTLLVQYSLSVECRRSDNMIPVPHNGWRTNSRGWGPVYSLHCDCYLLVQPSMHLFELVHILHDEANCLFKKHQTNTRLMTGVVNLRLCMEIPQMMTAISLFNKLFKIFQRCLLTVEGFKDSFYLFNYILLIFLEVVWILTHHSSNFKCIFLLSHNTGE